MKPVRILLMPALLAILMMFSMPQAAPAAAQSGAGPRVTTGERPVEPSPGSEGSLFGSKKKEKQDEEDEAEDASDDSSDDDKPSFAEKIKDARKTEGLFIIHRTEDAWLLEIKPDQLDRDFMMAVTRERGIGEMDLLGTMMLWDNPVRFQRVGGAVRLMLRNMRFFAAQDPERQRALQKSFSDSLLGSAPVLSKPHPESRAVLVDLGALLTDDVEGVGLYMAMAAQAPYTMDKANSGISAVKGFASNTEVDVTLHFAGPKPAPLANLADPRSFFLTYRYSLAQIPAAADYMPRLADDRLGHWLTLYQDLADDRLETPYVRYITRWNLQKEEPYAALSKPKEPITFWLENSIPKTYRKSAADGVLAWNKAFERIGIKDALVVKQQPDDADWDPADIRYATIRWFFVTDSVFAIGPSRIDPMTGRIYDADIGLANSLISYARGEFREMADPVAALKALRLDPRAPDGEPGPMTLRADPRLRCMIGSGLAHQAGLGYDMLRARGMRPGSAEEERYINDFVTAIIAHEVGHTLGLRHNFRASVVQPVDRLNDEARTLEVGLAGSVMDYTPVNIAPPGQKQGQYWQTTLGAYDYWAIEYAYKPVPAATKPEEEKAELARIAARVAQADLAYGTDEDFSDPRTNVWDLGSDNVVYFGQRMAMVRDLWKQIPTTLAAPGEGYQVMRRAFTRSLFELAPAILSLTKCIGGVYTYRDHVGDPEGRLPFAPVPAGQQRAALKFLSSELFAPGAFAVPPELLNRLALDRFPDFEYTVFRTPFQEFPLHDMASVLQRFALDQLYHPIQLRRMLDAEAQATAQDKPLTIADLFNDVQKEVWSELNGRAAPSVNSFRRSLQRDHLDKLVILTTRSSPALPRDAATCARANLGELRTRAEAALKAGVQDAATRAHLEETAARAGAALSAQMIRN